MHVKHEHFYFSKLKYDMAFWEKNDIGIAWRSRGIILMRQSVLQYLTNGKLVPILERAVLKVAVHSALPYKI